MLRRQSRTGRTGRVPLVGAPPCPAPRATLARERPGTTRARDAARVAHL